MSNLFEGKVIKGVGGVFTVLTEKGERAECKARKKTRYRGSEVLVGDNVAIADENGSFVIEKVEERRNSLVRPRVANVDKAFIVLTVKPAADLLLADKIIVNCIKENVLPYIVVNKCDITNEEFIDEIREDYGAVAEKIIVASAEEKVGMDEIRSEIKASVCCFVGQSAVGKTSIMNVITGQLNETGGLSKIDRGRHTTRHNEIFPVCGGFLIDTAGFSLLDEIDVRHEDLCLYYSDFTDFSGNCRFDMCTHTSEPDCAVISAVKEGKISKRRYERYLALYNELKERERRKY